jgi:glycosyltransferase involved in cell wall biosynthesis
LKITWASNAPWAPTGYGTQTKQMLTRLIADGHDVVVSANHGLAGAPARDPVTGIPVFPVGADPYGNDVILPTHALHTRGEPGWIITLYDVWVYRHPDYDTANVASWVPVDHLPTPPNVRDWCRKHPTIAMSRFGQEALRADGIDAMYAPHALELDVWKPTELLPNGKTPRQSWDIPDDAFVVMINAANKGNVPPRKSWGEMLSAVALFMRDHKDAYLYLHTETNGVYGGVDLQVLMASLDIPPERVRVPDWSANMMGLIPPSVLAAYYTASDVLLATSMGEGFGIPVIEAQACFPAGTPVAAEDVERGMVRSFTGSLIEIHTATGVVEATPDHPFWTDNGWIRAGDLTCGSRVLYTPEDVEARTISGRVEDVVGAVPVDATSRSGGANGALVFVGPVGEAHARTPEDIWPDRDREAGGSLRADLGLYRWVDRWRGDGVDPEIQREVEAAHPDREHVRISDGVAIEHGGRPGDLHRTPPDPRWSPAVLHVPYSRHRLGRSVRTSASVHGHQARADGGARRILPPTTWAGSDGSAERTAIVARLAGPRTEYQTVTQVVRREVVDLPVYNIKTRSGTYRAAGFLVHNCGTPVIVTDFSAQPELVGAGWTVGYQPWWDFTQGAWLALPNVSAIRDRLEQAYKTERGSMAAAAIAKAREYEADKVYAEHWRPILAKLEAKLHPPTRQQRRAKRRKS